MSKTIKVIIETENEIRTIKGSEAEKWNKHCEAVVQYCNVHGFNPFESDSIKWNVKVK